MANRDHLAILKQGVKIWNEWRQQNEEIEPKLSEADLRGADLRHSDLGMANLSWADLSHADLGEADLSGADLRHADLSMANLSGTELSHADLAGADLSGADLSGANLGGANISRANLSEADLTGAIMFTTTLGSIDLRVVKGLDSVLHHGPSSIGIDTIYQANGDIPEIFLRGAGVPEDFTTYIKSLVGKALDFYSCFISYSTKDQEFADRLHADLQSKGVRCWFAPHDMQPGRKIHEQIDEAIRVYDKLLLILSEHSMNSEWVKTEISKARKREIQQKRRMLFPVRLVSFEALRDWECFDADTGKDSAREIREFFIPDFSLWNSDHTMYKKEFGRLLLSLQPEKTDVKKV